MPAKRRQLKVERLVNHSDWNDDNCHKVWKHLVTDIPYDWPWDVSARTKFVEVTHASNDEIKRYSQSDLASARLLRSRIKAILMSDDEHRANEAATWIVAHWGGIKKGKDKISIWMESLKPFRSECIAKFIESHGTERVSSWSKILSFLDCEQYAIYDSRIAVALNSAMEIADARPVFHMPSSRNRVINDAIQILKNKHKTLSFGYSEYIFLLKIFVKIGKANSILEAERAVFAGAEATATKMIKKVKTASSLSNI
jgi:hypothetical protein